MGADAMKSTTSAMVKMNKAVDPAAMNKMMIEFEKENMKSEIMQEMMGEMMDDAMEQDGDEEDEDKIVSQVLDEIGISFGEEIPDAPMVGAGTTAAAASNGEKTPVLVDPAL